MEILETLTSSGIIITAILAGLSFAVGYLLGMRLKK